MRGFFAYVSSTRLTALSSGWGRQLPIPIDNGNGATLTEFELLRVDIDTTHVGVNECGTQEDGNCELVRDDERNPERRVPEPNLQPDNRAKLWRVAIRACQTGQGLVAYHVTRPVWRKVGLPHQIIPRTRTNGDRVGLESVVIRGYRAEDIINLRIHQADDPVDNLRRGPIREVVSPGASAPVLTAFTRTSSLVARRRSFVAVYATSRVFTQFAFLSRLRAHGGLGRSRLERRAYRSHDACYFLRRTRAGLGVFAWEREE